MSTLHERAADWPSHIPSTGKGEGQDAMSDVTRDATSDTIRDAANGGVRHIAVVHAPIDVGALTAQVEDAGVGAVSVFLGTVRRHNEGRAVTGIEYEAYLPMADRELRNIATEVCGEIAGLRVAIEHRVGTLVVGDVSVAIAASHARRTPALRGAEQLIERLKVRVPIWKREHYVDGDREWIDPTQSRAQGAAHAHAHAHAQAQVQLQAQSCASLPVSPGQS